MRFLSFLSETLRKYPPSPIITRNTTKDYKVPGLEHLTIKKNTRVTIPIYCFHHDPEFFEDPEKFEPRRFDDGKSHKAFFPFGDGQRSCIAERFGRLKIKIGLAVLLQKYRFTVSPQTRLPIEFSTTVPMLHTKNGVFLKWERI